jgi:hypothetical protein
MISKRFALIHCGVRIGLALVTGGCAQRLFKEQRAAEDARSDNGTANQSLLIGTLNMVVSFVEASQSRYQLLLFFSKVRVWRRLYMSVGKSWRCR